MLRTAVVHEHNRRGPNDGADEQEDSDGLVVLSGPIPKPEVRDRPVLRARPDAQAGLAAEPMSERLVPGVRRRRGERRARVLVRERRRVGTGRRRIGTARGSALWGTYGALWNGHGTCRSRRRGVAFAGVVRN